MNTATLIFAIFFLITTIHCAPKTKRHDHHEEIIKYRTAIKMLDNFLVNPEPPLSLISTRTFLGSVIQVTPNAIVLRRCQKEIVFGNNNYICDSEATRNITIEVNITVMEGDKKVNKMHKIHTVEHLKCNCTLRRH